MLSPKDIDQLIWNATKEQCKPPSGETSNVLFTKKSVAHSFWGDITKKVSGKHDPKTVRDCVGAHV